MKNRLAMQELIKQFTELTLAAVGGDGLTMEEAMREMRPAVRAFLDANAERNEWKLLKEVRDKATGGNTLQGDRQGHLDLNPDAIVPLGNGSTIAYRNCTRRHLHLRDQLIAENCDAVADKGRKERAAIKRALAKMGDEQTLGDVMGELQHA